MHDHDDGRRRLSAADISVRELDLADTLEGLETTQDIQVRTLLARRAEHLQIELETGYAQPFDDDEE